MDNLSKPTKYKLADHMRNSIHMPDDMLEHLSVYTLKHLIVPEFKNRLNDGQIYSGLDKHPYDVIYHCCTPFNAKRAKEVRLSFRAAKPEFDLPAIVLVQIVIQD